MGRPGHLQNEVMCGHEVGVGPNIHFPTSPSQVTHVTSKSGLESLTTFRPTSQILEAYSWSLHKLRREEMMVQRQGGDKAGYEEVDRERRWRERTRGSRTAHHLFGCVRYRTCVLQVLRWNSRFDHPGFYGGVCCLRER